MATKSGPRKPPAGSGVDTVRSSIVAPPKKNGRRARAVCRRTGLQWPDRRIPPDPDARRRDDHARAQRQADQGHHVLLSRHSSTTRSRCPEPRPPTISAPRPKRSRSAATRRRAIASSPMASASRKATRSSSGSEASSVTRALIRAGPISSCRSAVSPSAATAASSRCPSGAGAGEEIHHLSDTLGRLRTETRTIFKPKRWARMSEAWLLVTWFCSRKRA